MASSELNTADSDPIEGNNVLKATSEAKSDQNVEKADDDQDDLFGSDSDSESEADEANKIKPSGSSTAPNANLDAGASKSTEKSTPGLKIKLKLPTLKPNDNLKRNKNESTGDDSDSSSSDSDSDSSLDDERNDNAKNDTSNKIKIKLKGKSLDKSAASLKVKDQGKDKNRLKKGEKKAKTSKKDGGGDDFIDDEDDDASLVEEYRQQKEYDSDKDIDPYKDDEDNQNQDDQNDLENAEKSEQMKYVDNLINEIKARKQKRKSGDGFKDEHEREQFIYHLLQRMDKAYEDDIAARKTGVPGVNKLKLLSEVLDILRKPTLVGQLLDMNFLQVLGQWLKPSPIDATLPELTIRNRIYDVLPKLPIELDHLRRAQFGKVIAYLKDSEKETPSNRKRLLQLIQQWARMVYGKTDNFRMLEQLQSVQQEKNSNTNDLNDANQNSKANSTSNKINKSDVSSANTSLVLYGEKRKRDFLSRVRSVSEGGENVLENEDQEGEKAPKKIAYRAQIPRPQEFNFKRRVTENLTPKLGALGSAGKATPRTKLEKKLRSMRFKKPK